MFGHRYFGVRYFGPRYFGDGGTGGSYSPTSFARRARSFISRLRRARRRR